MKLEEMKNRVERLERLRYEKAVMHNIRSAGSLLQMTVYNADTNDSFESSVNEFPEFIAAVQAVAEVKEKKIDHEIVRLEMPEAPMVAGPPPKNGEGVFFVETDSGWSIVSNFFDGAWHTQSGVEVKNICAHLQLPSKLSNKV